MPSSGRHPTELKRELEPAYAMMNLISNGLLIAQRSNLVLGASLTFLVIAATPVLAQSDATSGVAVGDVNLRAGPGTGHRLITTIPAGASVEVISCERWCELRYGENTGWATANYIEIVTAEETTQPEPAAANVLPDTTAIANDDGGPLTDDELEVLVAPGSGYFGYQYRILKGQGDNVAGGMYDYVVNGNMIAGFGLIARPVEYGVTGVKPCTKRILDLTRPRSPTPLCCSIPMRRGISLPRLPTRGPVSVGAR